MKKRIIILALVLASLVITAIIITACYSKSTPMTENTCITCHTDKELLQQLTASIEPVPKSELISGEC